MDVNWVWPMGFLSPQPLLKAKTARKSHKSVIPLLQPASAPLAVDEKHIFSAYRDLSRLPVTKTNLQVDLKLLPWWCNNRRCSSLFVHLRLSLNAWSHLGLFVDQQWVNWSLCCNSCKSRNVFLDPKLKTKYLRYFSFTSVNCGRDPKSMTAVTPRL